MTPLPPLHAVPTPCPCSSRRESRTDQLFARIFTLSLYAHPYWSIPVHHPVWEGTDPHVGGHQGRRTAQPNRRAAGVRQFGGRR